MTRTGLPLMRATEAFVLFKDADHHAAGEEFVVAVSVRAYFRAYPIESGDNDVHVVSVRVGMRDQKFWQKWDVAQPGLHITVCLRAKHALNGYARIIKGEAIPSPNGGGSFEFLTLKDFKALEADGPINVGADIK